MKVLVGLFCVAFLLCILQAAVVLQGGTSIGQLLKGGRSSDGTDDCAAVLGQLVAVLSQSQQHADISIQNTIRTAIRAIIEAELKKSDPARRELLAAVLADAHIPPQSDHLAAPLEASPLRLGKDPIAIRPEPDPHASHESQTSNLMAPPEARRSRVLGKPSKRRAVLPTKSRHQRGDNVPKGQSMYDQIRENSARPAAWTGHASGIVSNASSGFWDVAPIAKMRCQLPYDIGSRMLEGQKSSKPPPLTVDMMKGASQAGMVVVCFTNARTFDMTMNWAVHLTMAGVRPMVGMMPDIDSDMASRLISRAVVFSVQSGTASDGKVHEREAQGGRWNLAVAVMRVALEANLSMLLSDNDVVWLRV